jgi:hypothetical protein
VVLYNASGNYLVAPELALSTKRGRRIPNEQGIQWPAVRMNAAKLAHLAAHPKATARSLRSLYNCMGMVFASRRTWIDPEHLEMILEDDEYQRIVSEAELQLGDLVIYRGDNNQVTHVGIISMIDNNLETAIRRLFVLSQWGGDGEYFHEIHDVSPYLGTPAEFWTDRL